MWVFIIQDWLPFALQGRRGAANKTGGTAAVHQATRNTQRLRRFQGRCIWLAKRVIATLPENLIELNEAMINDTMNGELETSENDEIFHLPFGPALCCAAVFFIFLH